MSTSEFAESDEALSISMNLYCNLKLVQNQLQRYEDSKMRLALIFLFVSSLSNKSFTMLMVTLFDRNYINFLARMRKSCPGCHVILPDICDISTTIQIFGRIKKILPHVDYKLVVLF